MGGDCPSKVVHVRQVEAEVLEAGASRRAWGRSRDLQVWTDAMTRLPMDLVPREGWQMPTEVTKPGASYQGNPAVQFLGGGEWGEDVVTAAT